MNIQVTEKTIRVYSNGDEIVEIDRDDTTTNFWYTRRGYGRKEYVFGFSLDIPFEDYLEDAFQQGSEMWEQDGIV